MDEDGLGQCGICHITGPLHAIQNHFLKNHVEHEQDNVQEPVEEARPNIETENEPFHWTANQVILLIRLVEKRQEMFITSLKKNVWIKIAAEMTSMTGKKFTYEQVDNKWKGLKKTYKKIKDYNNKTGNDTRNWEFFNAMDSFMRNKPEIVPAATCSTSSGLIINIDKENTTTENLSKPLEPSTSQNISKNELGSSIMRKRKREESSVQHRHNERMQKFDDFLKLYRLSVEHQIGTKIDQNGI